MYFAHKLHHASLGFITYTVMEAVMLELTQTRTTRQDYPGKIHWLDTHGDHHLFSEKDGILFYDGKIDDRMGISEEASRMARMSKILTNECQ